MTSLREDGGGPREREEKTLSLNPSERKDKGE
jgi:hypothetical protein